MQEKIKFYQERWGPSPHLLEEMQKEFLTQLESAYKKHGEMLSYHDISNLLRDKFEADVSLYCMQITMKTTTKENSPEMYGNGCGK